MNRYSRVEIRLRNDEKDMLRQQAKAIGFVSKSGNAQLSKYARAKLFSDSEPMHREGYQFLVENFRNLNRLGGLFNQYLHNVHRERIILEERGHADKNNIAFLKSLDRTEEEIKKLKDLVLEQKILMKKIINENTHK